MKSWRSVQHNTNTENNMSSDIVFEEAGTITPPVNNRVFWIIPKHIYLRRGSWFESSLFTLMGETWQLRFSRVMFSSDDTNMIRVILSIKHLSEFCKFKKLRIRLGISGKNKEVFEAIENDDYSLNSELPFRYFEIENIDEIWAHEGSFRFFAAVEKLDVNSKACTSQKVAENSAEMEVDKRNDWNEVGEIQAKEESGFKVLHQDLNNILLNGNFSDVVLKVDGQEFKSHRCILGARSPVFLAMLDHDTKEKATGVVDIMDVEPDIFSIFLNYLYTGNVKDITPLNALNIYVVADRYQVYELKNFCLCFILKNISVDNFCELLTLSLLQNENVLTDACNEFFMKHSLDIVKTSSWKAFLGEYPDVGNDLYIKQLEMTK